MKGSIKQIVPGMVVKVYRKVLLARLRKRNSVSTAKEVFTETYGPISGEGNMVIFVPVMVRALSTLELCRCDTGIHPRQGHNQCS